MRELMAQLWFGILLRHMGTRRLPVEGRLCEQFNSGGGRVPLSVCPKHIL